MVEQGFFFCRSDEFIYQLDDFIIRDHAFQLAQLYISWPVVQDILQILHI